jgi:hypothetical protein
LLPNIVMTQRTVYSTNKITNFCKWKKTNLKWSYK